MHVVCLSQSCTLALVELTICRAMVLICLTAACLRTWQLGPQSLSTMLESATVLPLHNLCGARLIGVAYPAADCHAQRVGSCTPQTNARVWQDKTVSSVARIRPVHSHHSYKLSRWRCSKYHHGNADITVMVFSSCQVSEHDGERLGTVEVIYVFLPIHAKLRPDNCHAQHYEAKSAQCFVDKMRSAGLMRALDVSTVVT
jgi:hypothetical protein